ncbi:hypothetical protein RN001_007846 [Aquatica leii]|uniref:Uncharacterized protein n=1 Tax=Aquatica leii TaxID=1421715 RepID=A0AAN7P3F9_9COLE|nr:hypothetical protein RN001_007846 [Aquatica leii]
MLSFPTSFSEKRKKKKRRNNIRAWRQIFPSCESTRLRWKGYSDTNLSKENHQLSLLCNFQYSTAHIVNVQVMSKLTSGLAIFKQC